MDASIWDLAQLVKARESACEKSRGSVSDGIVYDSIHSI